MAGPTNPLNDHRYSEHGCCAECIQWWDSPGGRSVYRMWEDRRADIEADRVARQREPWRRREGELHGQDHADIERAAREAELLPEGSLDDEENDDGLTTGYVKPPSFSTGRLTTRQADAVGAWREALMAGGEERPKASTSDVIAAAIEEMLAVAPPTPGEVAWYTVRTKQGHRAARKPAAQGGTGRTSLDVPRHHPVTFFLPQWFADSFNAFRATVTTAAAAVYFDAVVEARERYPLRPMAAERNALIAERMAAANLPEHLPKCPPGIIARMAIDRWVDRPVYGVIADAAAYSARVHTQQHRARQDMRKVKR
ncbi:hypothetical protein GCM10027589_04700 [Actinocorallia lasiicapitis]